MAPPAPSAPGAPLGAPRLALTILVPFAAGYFMSYLFRNINAVVGRYLIDELDLGAADIGLLTAAYFLTFAAFQIPLGVLLDRFGPRRVNSVLLCIAATGAILFSFGSDRDTLALARGLIGLGVSGCLMSSFQAITLWYPKERWAFFNGVIMTVGGLGAVAGTAPIEAALKLTDWRGLFQMLGALTVIVAIVLFAVAPDRRRTAPPDRVGAVIRGMGRIYANRTYWSMAPLLAFTQAANLAILGLWGGLWLRDVAGLGREAAAVQVGMMNIGLTAGFVLIALVSEVAARRRIPLERIMTVMVLAFLVAQALVVLRVDAGAAWPWIFFGMFANAAIFCYPLLAARLPLDYSGRANTSANLVSFVGGFAGQYLIGWAIDLFPRQAAGGYAPRAYDVTFGALLGLEILGFLWFLYAFRRSQRPAAPDPAAS